MADFEVKHEYVASSAWEAGKIAVRLRAPIAGTQRIDIATARSSSTNAFSFFTEGRKRLGTRLSLNFSSSNWNNWQVFYYVYNFWYNANLYLSGFQDNDNLSGFSQVSQAGGSVTVTGYDPHRVQNISVRYRNATVSVSSPTGGSTSNLDHVVAASNDGVRINMFNPYVFFLMGTTYSRYNAARTPFTINRSVPSWLTLRDSGNKVLAGRGSAGSVRGARVYYWLYEHTGTLSTPTGRATFDSSGRAGDLVYTIRGTRKVGAPPPPTPPPTPTPDPQPEPERPQPPPTPPTPTPQPGPTVRRGVWEVSGYRFTMNPTQTQLRISIRPAISTPPDTTVTLRASGGPTGTTYNLPSWARNNNIQRQIVINIPLAAGRISQLISFFGVGGRFANTRFNVFVSRGSVPQPRAGNFSISQTSFQLDHDDVAFSFSITPTVSPSAAVTLSGTGIPGSVTYTLPDWAAGDTSSKTATIVVPRNLAAGNHTATITAAGGNYQGRNFQVMVSKAAPPPPPEVPVVAPPTATVFVPAPTIQYVAARQESYRDVLPDMLINPPSLNIVRGTSQVFSLTLVAFPSARGAGILNITGPTGITTTPDSVNWLADDVNRGDPVRRIVVNVDSSVGEGSYNLTLTGAGRFQNIQPFTYGIVVPSTVTEYTGTSVREKADTDRRNAGDWLFEQEGDLVRWKDGIYAGLNILTDDYETIDEFVPVAGNLGDLSRTYDGPMRAGGSIRPVFIDAYYNGQPLDGNSLCSFFELYISDPVPDNDGQIELALRRRVRTDLQTANRRVANKFYVSALVYAIRVGDEFYIVQAGGQGRGVEVIELAGWLDRNVSNIRHVQGFNPNYYGNFIDTQFLFQDTLEKAVRAHGIDIGTVITKQGEGEFQVMAYDFMLDGRGSQTRMPVRQLQGIRR